MTTVPSCCPSDSLGPAKFDAGPSVGVIREMEASGNQAKMNIYITPPGSLSQSISKSKSKSKSKRVVVVFSDVYGYSSGLHFQFADALAKRIGGSVVVPDLFRGSPCMQPWSLFGAKVGGALGFPAMLFRAKFWYHPMYVNTAITDFILPWLRRVSSIKNVEFSCVGFCFGGWVIGKTMGHGVPWKCGVGIHPAFNLEQIHGGTESSLAKGVLSIPYFLMPAGNDSKQIKVGGTVTAILAKARNVKESQVSLEFPEMSHGWVPRGNPEDDNIRNAQNKALEKTAEFILKHHILNDENGCESKI